MLHSKSFSILFAFLAIFYAADVQADQVNFELKGIYLEGCTCKVVCACDLEGKMAEGCHVMGALIIESGSYENFKLSKAKIAFAMGDKWVRIYMQTKDAEQNRMAAKLAQAIFSAYGIVESIQNAEIELFGSNGSYSLRVDGGKIIDMKTQPVIGANGKTAVTYTNYPDPLFQTIMQAKVISGNYNDDNRHFTLEGTNSFFNQEWSVSGKI